MLKNYFKVGLRSLLKNRFYSLINLLGLSVGITCSVLLFLYVNDELSYDKFHKDYDNIHRVTLFGSLAGQKFNMPVANAQLAKTMKEEFPEVEAAIRLNLWNEILMAYEEKSFSEEYVLLADSNFFSFFDFNLIEGDPDNVLTGPNKIVISEDLAIKYFDWKGPGDNSPLGKLMKFSTGTRTVEVTGIVENTPSNSHIPYDLILSMESYEGSRNTQWVSNNFFTYFKKRPDVAIETTHENLDKLVDKYVAPQIEQFLGKSMEEFEQNGDMYRYRTQAFSDIHLRSNLEVELKPGGNISYVYILSAIGIFVLLLACINFMNLSTARSASRAKEVGIRKTSGSTKTSILAQFLTESVIISILSLLPAFLLIYISLSPFNSIAGKTLGYDIFFNPFFYLGMLSLAILVGILAGLYPAFYLNKFRPVEVLKGKLSKGAKNSGLRSFLVVFQFSISIVLIICTLIVYKQLNMMQTKNLGFDKENILIIDNARKLGNQLTTFRDEITKYDDVLHASVSQSYPPYIMNNSVLMGEGSDEQELFHLYFADEYHLQTLGFELAEGRFFDIGKGDSSVFIINEAAMNKLNWESIENKRLRHFFNSEEGTLDKVVGVVKDFNFQSLRTEIRPLAFRYTNNGSILSIRLSKGDVRKKVEFIEGLWNQYTDNAAFQYSFIDQEFNKLFESERRLGQVSIIFTSLAIFVACLGLFGLATFMGEQRKKEIGVRKVLGASNAKIVSMLVKNFAILVFIGFIIAIPISSYFMNEWLQTFAYKTSVGIIPYLTAGAGAMIVATLTITVQSYRASASNPVQSLRSE